MPIMESSIFHADVCLTAFYQGRKGSDRNNYLDATLLSVFLPVHKETEDDKLSRLTHISVDCKLLLANYAFRVFAVSTFITGAFSIRHESTASELITFMETAWDGVALYGAINSNRINSIWNVVHDDQISDIAKIHTIPAVDAFIVTEKWTKKAMIHVATALVLHLSERQRMKLHFPPLLFPFSK